MDERVPFYKRRWVIITAVLVLIPALALAWWLGSPLFIDRVVDEPFPRAAMAVVPDDMTMEQVEEMMEEAEAENVMVEEPMPEMPETPDPAPAAAETTTAPGTAAPPTTAAGTTEAPATTAAATTTTQPAGPVLLYRGEFVDGDSFHTGSGDVLVYRLEDDSLLLRMEDIEVKNGPNLDVIVTPSPTVTGRDDVRVEGHLDLGDLKGNIGSQNYELPADYTPPDEFSVVVFCVPFQVVFASAEMRPA